MQHILESKFRIYSQDIFQISSWYIHGIDLDDIQNMFTVSIMEYSVNKLESQWGWSSHIMLRYLQVNLIVRFTPFQQNVHGR